MWNITEQETLEALFGTDNDEDWPYGRQPPLFSLNEIGFTTQRDGTYDWKG